ncbi:8-amino-7-oxononanoate synthase [Alteromonadaceae bacterium M269]|nr:8-amino-7-oxononanoate synthase [Alteromonadaceae bacterium M269]
MAFDFISQKLAERKQDDLYRARQPIDLQQSGLIQINDRHYINFSSNDYLGLRTDYEVMQSWCDAMVKHGMGSSASPLVTGYSVAHQELEEYLAEALGYESVLLFNSGFTANQAICQALMQKNTTCVADKLIHASFIEGALAASTQGATFKRFKHNDCEHLSALLGDTDDDCLIATEGVFSMDGDQAPLSQIALLAEKHNAWLMIDDAHGFGVLGETGLGSLEASKLSSKEVPLLMGTFGKAVGTAGAFVAATKQTIDYLVNFSRHAIYSTAMPPAQATATLTSIKKIRQGDVRAELHENILLFKTLAKEAGLPLMESDTAIQPILVPGAKQALEASEALKSLGLWVSAIRSPTVPKEKDRLRITLSAIHRPEDIQALVEALSLVTLEGRA